MPPSDQPGHPSPSVGTSPLRKEGPSKVRGAAQYIDDLSLPEMLFGATVRSTHPRARILSIRFPPHIPWDEFTIVTAADIPGPNTIIHLGHDHPCLADTITNHPEEPILLLAHPDKHRLPEAVAAVEITYEPLPAVFTIEESEAEDAPEIWRPSPLDPHHPHPRNTFKRYTMEHGDLHAAFAAAAHIVEAEYTTGAQEQLYIEPNGVLATWDPATGSPTVRGSMQCPFYVVHALSVLFALPQDRCRVIQTETGGAFGGKEDFPSVLACHAALLARRSGRPVKMTYDRAEDLLATTKRHPSRTRHRTAVAADGAILGGEIDFAIDGGAYATLTPVVLSRGTIHAAGPYRWPALKVTAKAMATNVPPHGAFRGFGAPQSLFAMERHMDRIARTVGLTAEELRRRNLLATGDRTATGQLLTEPVDMQHLLTRALEEADYHRKTAGFARTNPASPIRRGIGFATFMHGAGFTGSGERRLDSEVAIRLCSTTGRPELLVSSTEFGQGTNTILCQVAADALCLPYDAVSIALPDTALVPNSGPTVASRTAMIVGKLVQQCAESIVHALTSAKLLGPAYSPEEFFRAAVQWSGDGQNSEFRARYQAPGEIFWDDEGYKGDAYPAYGWAVYVAEVALDTRTYQASVTDFHALQEVGRVLHPILAAGQIQGGVAQGIGYALYEKCVYERGRMMNHQMTNYIMPTSLDLPEIHVHFEETPSVHGAFGAKGIGELPMDGPAPAILNALEQATGYAFRSIPLLPEDIFEALSRAPGGGSESLDPAEAGPYYTEPVPV